MLYLLYLYINICYMKLSVYVNLRSIAWIVSEGIEVIAKGIKRVNVEFDNYTIAAFKFEEITNIKVEPLTTVFASLGGEIMPHHKTICKIIESETTPLKEPQRKRVEQLIKSKYMAL